MNMHMSIHDQRFSQQPLKTFVLVSVNHSLIRPASYLIELILVDQKPMHREPKLISEIKYFISSGKFPNFNFRTPSRVICNEVINK